jgi:hypothetical protein
MDNNDAITSWLIFSDDATFSLLKRVNRHNSRICVSENRRDSFEHEWDVPKLNNFVAVLELIVHGQLFCAESRVTASSFSRLGAGLIAAAVAGTHRSGCTKTASLRSLMKGGRTYTYFS